MTTNSYPDKRDFQPLWAKPFPEYHSKYDLEDLY
ncbi:hypothetical protein N7516_008157 [Penicillium verrucosum]|nr:uncharacterized protein N7516_008157 [Penicillium verrucosum]KAJ5926384.1 hypothetical protein N7516_008157 [Penicillium verrucosum]